MKSTMSLEERKALKEKREKNLKSKGKTKFTESDDMSLLIKKKTVKLRKAKTRALGIIIRSINMIMKKIFMNLHTNIYNCKMPKGYYPLGIYYVNLIKINS